MFIELFNGDFPVWVNIEHIVRIEMLSNGKTTITMTDGMSLTPNETYEEVTRLLEDALEDLEDMEEV